MEIEVRDLTVEDVFTVARMLGKVTNAARSELSSALTAEGGADPTQLGMLLFQTIIVQAETDMKAWLADLIGKDVEEFKAMPATTVIDIIEKLTEKEDIADFFGRVSQLVVKLGESKWIKSLT